MPRCPNCQAQVAPPEDKKVVDCRSCGTPLKLRGQVFRYVSSECLGIFLSFALWTSEVGVLYAIVLGIAAGLGLWFWLGRYSLAPARP